MREQISTALDLIGSSALVAGVFILAGVGWAALMFGAVLLGISWGLSGRPVPKRTRRDDK